MRNTTVITSALVILETIGSYSVWLYVDHLDYLNRTVHETDRWLVITDSRSDIIAIETTMDEV